MLAGARVGYRAVFGVGEFRALWAAEALSQAGDQLARVALSVLVYSRTNSTLLTALTYGLTYLPTLVGGAVFGSWADRYPRRTVMIVCDLARAVLVAAMAVSGVPLWVLLVLLAVVVGVGGPFRAAYQALLPDVLGDGELYIAGMAIRNITVQTAQLVGFAGGGVLVAALTAQGGLVVDAVTFALSGVLVLAGVKPRPAAAPAGKHSTLWQAWHGIRLCAGDPGLRSLIGLAALAGLYMAPEGIAAPYAASLSYSGFSVGLIMAADPAGSVLGALLVTRVPEKWRLSGIGVLAAATGVPLLVCFTRPGLAVSLVAFALVGVLSTMYLVPMSAAMARGTPNEHRAQVMGLYSTTVVTTQGVGALVTGAVAQWLTPAVAIGVSGVAVIVLGLPLASRWVTTLTSEPARWAPSADRIGE